MLLVDIGQGGTNASFWLLAAVAILITLSLCRFVIFGLPAGVTGDRRSRRSLMQGAHAAQALCAAIVPLWALGAHPPAAP